MATIFFGTNSGTGTGTRSDPYASLATPTVNDGDTLVAQSGKVFWEAVPAAWRLLNNLRFLVYGGSNRPIIDVGTARSDFTYNSTYSVWTRQYASNVVGCVRNGNEPLVFVPWNTNIATTRNSMGEGSWTFDGVNFILYIVSSSTPSVIVGETNYCANWNAAISGWIMEGWGFYGASRHALSMQGPTDMKFVDVEVGLCGGLYIGGSAMNLGNGIEMTDTCARIEIVRPYIHDVFDSGITPQLYDENATISDIVIRDGTITRCGQAGVEVSIQGGTSTVTMSDIAVYKNDVSECGFGWSGIRYSGGWGLQIVANKTGAGFVIKNVGFYQNRIKDCNDAGIVMSRWKSDSVQVWGNEIDDCGAGIRTTYIAGETAGSMVASGNIIRGCDKGLRIGCDVSGTTLYYDNNTIAGCPIGVSAEGTAGTAHLRNNIVRDCTTGIYKTGAGTLTKGTNTLWNNTTDYDGPSQGDDVIQNPMHADSSYLFLNKASPCLTGGTDVGIRQGRRGVLRAPHPIGASKVVAPV